MVGSSAEGGGRVTSDVGGAGAGGGVFSVLSPVGDPATAMAADTPHIPTTIRLRGCMVGSGGRPPSAEVGFRGLLTRINHAAADFPRTREKLFELISLAPPDRPRERLKILGEST